MNKTKQYYPWMIALLAILAVCAACYFCFKPQPKEELVVSGVKKETKIITVFIHGSIRPDDSFIDTISLTDLNTILFDTIEDDSEYMKSLRRVRANPELCKDQIMLEEGFQEVQESQIAHLVDIQDTKIVHQSKQDDAHQCACCHHAHHAHAEKPAPQNAHSAHYAIAGYNSLMKQLFPNCDTAYYTFGHLGVLSHRYREAVAKNLYNELIAKVAEAKDRYEMVKVVLVTHSHGGTIALNMAHVENELKRGLVIDNLVLFGTPLQHETAPHACHPMFKRVLNCYSLGDTMQGSDILTTASRKCYKTFSSIESLPAHKQCVYDVQLVVNDDGRAITHSKMWYIIPKEKAASQLDPLPCAILTPALIAAFDSHTFGSSVQAAIRSQEGHLALEVQDVEKKAQYISPNTYDVVARLRDQITSQFVREHA